MTDIFSYIQSIAILNDADTEKLVSHLKPVTYEKDEVIFRPNVVCNEIFILSKGLVRCHYLYDSKEVNLRLLCEPSAVIAFSSYIEETKSIETVEAIEACEGFLITRQSINALAESIPAIKDFQLYIAGKHYISMERRLLTIQHKNIEERLRYFQSHMEASIVERTPAIHIASYLGIPPESLSRAKRALNKR